MSDDLKARLTEQANDMMFNDCLEAETMREAAAHITALEAQLAAKDAEIAAWLRERAKTAGGSWQEKAAAATIDVIATAIASGAYRKDEAND